MNAPLPTADSDFSYDPACETLAEHFLGQHSRDVAALSQHIQDAIEDWLSGPACAYCGTHSGLRRVHDGGGFMDPEYTCQECFTPQDDGPCFDDLEAVS